MVPARRPRRPLEALLPRRWTARLARVGGDLRMVGGMLRGHRPPYLIPRGPRTDEYTRRPVIRFEEVRVLRTTRETPDAISIVFEPLDERPLKFEAGQFVTLEVEIDDELYRRAYSFSSAPADGYAQITVKQIGGGRVSRHLNESIEVGATLKARFPSGSFGAPPADGPRHLVLVAGGSGITPMMSVLRQALRTEPDTRITLIYGNRRAEDVIFREALDELSANEPRLTVDHVLEHPTENHTGARGVLDRATLGGRLGALGVDCEDATFLVCGPDAMRMSCREELAARGVSGARIFEERFVRPELIDEDARLPKENVTVRFRRNGRDRAVVVAPGRTLLEAGLSGGTQLPFSCTMGGCASCRLRLVEGEVHMEEPNCLTAAERDEGFVLSCVSRPVSPCVLEVPE